MQVPEYIGNFREVTTYDDLQLGAVAIAFGPSGAMLDGMLRRIGIDDPRDTDSELYCIAEEVVARKPQVLEFSTAVCQELNVGSHNGVKRDSMRVMRRDEFPPEDDTRTPEQLEEGVQGSIEAVRFMITSATLQTLASLVLMSTKMNSDKAAIQAIGNTQREFNNVYSIAAGGELIIERSFIGDRRVGQATVDFQPALLRRAPEWIKKAHQWDDGPVDLAAGFHVEEDGLVIVREWCKARKNGYVPVLASKGIDSGQHSASRREANLQADALLVRVGDEPDVLPVQMKNIVNEDNRAEYDPRVVLMSAQDMGGVVMRTDRVRDTHGNLRTGSIARTIIGRITCGYSSAANARNNQKQQAQKFSRSLRPQVDRFEQLVAKSREAN